MKINQYSQKGNLYASHCVGPVVQATTMETERKFKQVYCQEVTATRSAGVRPQQVEALRTRRVGVMKVHVGFAVSREDAYLEVEVDVLGKVSKPRRLSLAGWHELRGVPSRR
ncbi:hypothetical protein ATANTOWER_026448 [Ataeniobius toweri]|uniref:Uncharacterized protein n=1 Tax=Ataeniobius toweri TaxID=208326 RepID=A0ABU7BKP8_9TELE|nr:hypothetical protein [Ataeniobius toweri]